MSIDLRSSVRRVAVRGQRILVYCRKSEVIVWSVHTENFRIARHPPKDDYEAAEGSNVVRANGQIKKLLRRVRYHFLRVGDSRK